MIQLHHGDCVEQMKRLPDNCVDAIVTDPPYGLSREPDMAEVLRHWRAGDDYVHKGAGFMGKSWDSFVPGPTVWREALRVLRPGGHVVAFYGTRTYDMGVLAMRLAGFEIRDQLAWVFGSGFPKSLDVSKAIDKLDAADARRERQLRFTQWMRGAGLNGSHIDALTGTNMGGQYTTAASQPAVATREHFEMLRPHFTCDVPAWVEQMVDDRTVESENFKRREVIGERDMRDTSEVRIAVTSSAGDYDTLARRIVQQTAPATPEAAKWEGWGTALKPAYEPIVLARKPLIGTVASNVTLHGTGAINIEGCRVGNEVRHASFTSLAACAGNRLGAPGTAEARRGTQSEPQTYVGRWPANLAHDGSDEVLAQFPDSAGQQARARTDGSECGNAVYGAMRHGTKSPAPRGDVGSAARFFYCAKAGKRDRNEGLEGPEVRQGGALNMRADAHAAVNGNLPAARANHHPTVKPTDLMRWLCRLVTPPGGTVLDPFMGSGSTGKAAALEGFGFTGIEREAEYLAIAEARICAALAERLGLL